MINFAIIITTYKRNDGNTPFYVKRALKSVLEQEYKNYKVYVIGDYYSDNEEFISLFEDFPKDKIYYENLPFAYERDKYQDKSLVWKYGGCFANNYAINKSLIDGFEYICRLDHDDEWLPNHLSVLNDAIIKTNSWWLCTKSIYGTNSILPNIQSPEQLIGFYPKPESLIHSSTCINFKKIQIRHRNYYEETGNTGLPGDADTWGRMSEYLKRHNQIGCLVNIITCKHIDEGYEKR